MRRHDDAEKSDPPAPTLSTEPRHRVRVKAVTTGSTPYRAWPQHLRRPLPRWIHQRSCVADNRIGCNHRRCVDRLRRIPSISILRHQKCAQPLSNGDRLTTTGAAPPHQHAARNTCEFRSYRFISELGRVVPTIWQQFPNALQMPSRQRFQFDSRPSAFPASPSSSVEQQVRSFDIADTIITTAACVAAPRSTSLRSSCDPPSPCSFRQTSSLTVP